MPEYVQNSSLFNKGNKKKIFFPVFRAEVSELESWLELRFSLTQPTLFSDVQVMT